MIKFKIKRLNHNRYKKIVSQDAAASFNKYFTLCDKESIFIKKSYKENLIFLFIISTYRQQMNILEYEYEYEYEYMIYDFKSGNLQYIDNDYSSCNISRLLKCFDGYTNNYQKYNKLFFN